MLLDRLVIVKQGIIVQGVCAIRSTFNDEARSQFASIDQLAAARRIHRDLIVFGNVELLQHFLFHSGRIIPSIL